MDAATTFAAAHPWWTLVYLLVVVAGIGAARGGHG